MQYLIIESFRGGDPVPVYRRFRDRGATWLILRCCQSSPLERYRHNWLRVCDWATIVSIPNASSRISSMELT
jgi:hypothetical protein